MKIIKTPIQNSLKSYINLSYSLENVKHFQNSVENKDFYSIFLSVVFVVRNQECYLDNILGCANAYVSSHVSDYELIVVDNASVDQSVQVLKKLTSQEGLPNLQVYALTKEVSCDTAAWVGLENALGDFVVVIDPLVEDLAFLSIMLKKAVHGADVVFAKNKQQPRQSFVYQLAKATFNLFYKSFCGIHLAKEASGSRLLSKRVINFILQHPQPSIQYRHLPVTAGFVKDHFEYSSKPIYNDPKKLGERINVSIRLLVSTTQVPMRLVTSLSLFGATANLFYTFYVLIIGITKTNIAPGWISISLQQSGMFFLISLLFLVLGEYILHMSSLSNEGPLYHVGQEFTSVHMTRKEKLNIETRVTRSETSEGVSQSKGTAF